MEEDHVEYEMKRERDTRISRGMRVGNVKNRRRILIGWREMPVADWSAFWYAMLLNLVGE